MAANTIRYNIKVDSSKQFSHEDQVEAFLGISGWMANTIGEEKMRARAHTNTCMQHAYIRRCAHVAI